MSTEKPSNRKVWKLSSKGMATLMEYLLEELGGQPVNTNTDAKPGSASKEELQALDDEGRVITLAQNKVRRRFVLSKKKP